MPPVAEVTRGVNCSSTNSYSIALYCKCRQMCMLSVHACIKRHVFLLLWPAGRYYIWIHCGVTSVVGKCSFIEESVHFTSLMIYLMQEITEKETEVQLVAV